MKSMESRFWEKVDSGDPRDCWEWKAAKFTSGYGQLGVRHPDGKYRMEGAHRVSWVIHRGPIPARHCVLHRCDNPACVNPEHLFIGSKADNVADMVAKGRHVRGEKRSKTLKNDDVRTIRRRVLAGERRSDVAAAYNLSKSAVAMIVLRKRWAHVS